jgi:hypothetical protein
MSYPEKPEYPYPTPPGYVPPQPPQGMPYPSSGAPTPGYPAPVQYSGGQYPMPITAQPAMPLQPPVELATNTAGGPLGYLAAVDQLIVKQEIHALDVMTNVTTNTKYDIVNSLGQQVYRAEEESGWCARQCCSACRGWDITIKDNMDNPIIKLSRPCKCCGCCFPCCCMQEMIIECPFGVEIGKIEEKWTFIRPNLSIYSEMEEHIFSLKGPACPGAMWHAASGDVHFKIEDSTGHHVGNVSKQWGGVIQEMFTSTNNFNVKFPIDMPVKQKAILLSSAFLLNFMYFQRVPVQHQNHEHGSNN